MLRYTQVRNSTKNDSASCVCWSCFVKVVYQGGLQDNLRIPLKKLSKVQLKKHDIGTSQVSGSQELLIKGPSTACNAPQIGAPKSTQRISTQRNFSLLCLGGATCKNSFVCCFWGGFSLLRGRGNFRASPEDHALFFFGGDFCTFRDFGNFRLKKHVLGNKFRCQNTISRRNSFVFVCFFWP